MVPERVSIVTDAQEAIRRMVSENPAQARNTQSLRDDILQICEEPSRASPSRLGGAPPRGVFQTRRRPMSGRSSWRKNRKQEG